MKRLLLIIFCHLSIYCSYSICDYRHPFDVDAFDLMKHNGYYLIIIASLLMSKYDKVYPYENFVEFLYFVFIWGVLVNCFIFNLQDDKDRNFHWYSVLLVFLSLFGGIQKGWPVWHKKVSLYFINEKIYNFLCQIKK